MSGERVNMKKLLLILSSSLILFTGCSTVTPAIIAPRLLLVSPTNLTWEGLEHNGVRGYFLTQYEWEYVQTELIIKGTAANQCIDILNNSSQSKD